MDNVPAASVNAYVRGRKFAEGCQHRLGCKCEIPFWLRPFSPAELAWVEKRQLVGEVEPA